jgi:hypothetical protein
MSIKTVVTDLEKKPESENKKIINEEFVKKSTAPISSGEAKIFGEALDKLRRKDGKIYTEDVLKKAKDPKHILHNYRGFDWDRQSASDKWNRLKAGELIRSISLKITYKETKSKEISIRVVPAFANTKRFDEGVKNRELRGEGGSKKMTDILENSHERDKLIVDFGLRLKSLISRYDYLYEYYPELKKKINTLKNTSEHIIDNYYHLTNEELERDVV